MMAVTLLAIGIIGLAMLVMAVGVIFKNRCLRGSCGGIGVRGPGGELLTCDSCPRRDELECAETEGPASQLGANHCGGVEVASPREMTVPR